MSPSLSKSIPCLLLLNLLLAGCGGGSASIQPPPPPAPMFTSTPVAAAEEGMPYSYELAATVSGSSAITFALTTAPAGATLSSGTINWTPTHAESRISNSFVVTASTAAGGSATQSWTVTPTGNVNITAVTTYWTPTGSIKVFPTWQAGILLAVPVVLVPQSDGSFQNLQGAANPDSSFTIPNVPGGFYWLELSPRATYWTSASDFDGGLDIVGDTLLSGPNANTTFDYSVSGITPSSNANDYFTAQSNVGDFFSPIPAAISPNTTTMNFDMSVNGNVNWSNVSTLYLSQFQYTSSGNFTGYLLGPSQTLTDDSFSTGATNAIDVTLSPAPPISVPIDIAGTAWAPIAPLVGPGSPAPTYSAFSVFAQPYVTDRYAQAMIDSPFGPDFPLLSTGTVLPPPDTWAFGPSYGCRSFISYLAQTSPNTGVSPIVADTNFGALSYDDPYPTNWPRLFQYCQVSSINLPRPNSTATDTFLVSTEETTLLPTSPVDPLLTPVQSPTLNGSSLFQTTTLNTTTLQFSWAPPSIGQPYAYFLEVYTLAVPAPGTPGTPIYVEIKNYATTQTSLALPSTLGDGIYVFAIVAALDASANIETSPNRHKVPMAHSTVISAPFVISTSATSTAAKIK
jgi:hypothetical protein